MSEIFIECSLRDALSCTGEEAVHPMVTISAVVVEGDKAMFKIESHALDCLVALKCAASTEQAGS